MEQDQLSALDEVLDHVLNGKPVAPGDVGMEPARKAAASTARSRIAAARLQIHEQGRANVELLREIDGYAKAALTDLKCEQCGRAFGPLQPRDYARLWQIVRVEKIAGVALGVLHCGECSE
jgi:hypothetical protein